MPEPPALEESRLFDALLDPVAIVDGDGTILRVNQAMARYVQLPREQLIGKKCFALIHGTEDHIEGCPLQASRISHQRETMEMSIAGKTFFVVTDPIHSEGEITGFIHTIRDITSYKQALAELSENAGLLQMAVRMAHLGGWMVDIAKNRVIWSDEVAAIHGMPAGYSPTVEEGIRFYAPQWRERIREVYTACATEGIPYDKELEIVTNDGRTVWVRTVGEAIRDPDGKIIKVQGAFQNISERKLAEAQHKKLLETLMTSQKIDSIGRLAGGIAHDFNNLLSVVLNYTGFALESVNPGDPLFSDLEEIRNAAERAATLTRQLLAFSRQQHLEPVVINLNRVIDGMKGMLHRLLGETITLKLDLDDDLWNTLADTGKIEQVIMNLAINARDAMDGEGTIVLSTRNVLISPEKGDCIGIKPGSCVKFSVSDSGCGMNQEILSRIFEPFYTTKEMNRGTGLGLSIVHGIVRQSGGGIHVDSIPGQGTTFEIFLPRVQNRETGTIARQGTVTALASELILIVEDEDAVRRIAERVLQRAGYRTLTANNGGEALLLCEQHPEEIQLLLTDVVMPMMNGRELSERLTRLRPDLRTLFMSGYSVDNMTCRDMLEPGMHFIGKPFSASGLTRKVREVLDHKGNPDIR